MNLSDLYSFFSSVSDDFQKGSFFQKHVVTDRINDIKDIDLIIMGVPDDEQGKVFGSANEIRRQLFRLAALSKKFQLLDIGNLNSDVSLSETFSRLKKAIDILQNFEIKVAIIGGSSIFNKPLVSSYLTNQIPLNIASIDSKITWEHLPIDALAIDMQKSAERSQANFINIGYQSYYLEKEIQDFILENHFEIYRLGLVRAKIPDFEPVLRDANVINLNIDVVKFSDAPGAKFPSPNGLTGDEFCQLAFYAGFSTHLKFITIYDLIVSNDTHSVTSCLASQALWYLCEGFANQVYEDPELTPDHFTKYHIHLDTANQNISFYQSALTKRWWMEIDLTNSNRKIILSSSEIDYEMACKQEIPDRWWRLFNRI